MYDERRAIGNVNGYGSQGTMETRPQGVKAPSLNSWVRGNPRDVVGDDGDDESWFQRDTDKDVPIDRDQRVENESGSDVGGSHRQRGRKDGTGSRRGAFRQDH